MFCDGDTVLMARIHESIKHSQRNTLQDEYEFMDDDALMELHKNNRARVDSIKAECRNRLNTCCFHLEL